MSLEARTACRLENSHEPVSEHLIKLAKRRQAETPDGYFGIGDYHGGSYECDHVSSET